MRTDLFATDEKRMIPGGIPSASEAPLSPAAQEKTFNPAVGIFDSGVTLAPRKHFRGECLCLLRCLYL